MNLKINNLLILGATGFIGQSVYREFRKTYPDLNIHVLIRSEEKAKDFKHKHTKVHIGRLETFNWQTIEVQIDYIFHFARNSSSRGRQYGRYLASLKGWYGNRRVLSFMKKTNVNHLFYMSGSLMYGHHHTPVLENQILNPVSFAREYKIAEQPFLRMQKKVDNSIHVSFIRVPWVLGHGSWFQAFFKSYIDRKQVVPMYGKGNNIMSFILLSDIGKALTDLLKEKTFKPVYHLAYKKGLLQSEFVHILSEVTDLPVVNIELSEYEKAVQEAFQSSIPLHPSSEFSVVTNDVSERVSEFLRESL